MEPYQQKTLAATLLGIGVNAVRVLDMNPLMKNIIGGCGIVLTVVAFVLFIVSFPAVQQWLRSLKTGLVNTLTAMVITILLVGGVWSLLGGQRETLKAEQELAAVQSAPPSTTQQSLISSVPSYIVSVGDDVCGLLMSFAGHNTKSDPIVATPIVYLLWVRLFNQTDYKVLVDGDYVQLSDSAAGPWVDTFSLPIKFSASYCNYPQGNDPTENTWAFHGAMEMLRNSKNGIKLTIDEGYTVATSSGLSCLQKCTPLDIPDLESNLTAEIEPHTTAAGWVAVNPPAAKRPTLAHRYTFYRLTAHTITGDVISSGQMGRKSGAMVYRSDAYLRLQITDEWDSGHIPLAYVGASERKE